MGEHTVEKFAKVLRRVVAARAATCASSEDRDELVLLPLEMSQVDLLSSITIKLNYWINFWNISRRATLQQLPSKSHHCVDVSQMTASVGLWWGMMTNSSRGDNNFHQPRRSTNVSTDLGRIFCDVLPCGKPNLDLFRLEITSRMAPKAVFKAFRMIRNNGSQIVTYDQQSVAVDLEDRTLVSKQPSRVFRWNFFVVSLAFSPPCLFCQRKMTFVQCLFFFTELLPHCCNLHNFSWHV